MEPRAWSRQSLRSLSGLPEYKVSACTTLKEEGSEGEIERKEAGEETGDLTDKLKGKQTHKTH